MRAAFFFLFAFFALLWAPLARAQEAEVQASVDSNEVELGDTVTFTMQASSPREQPGDPSIKQPSGFTVVTSGASPSHMVSIVNGHASEKHGLNASWVLRADRLGTFTIGPGTVTIGGAKKSSQAVRVTVVAPGAGKPKRRQPQNPFDLFGGGSGSGFDPFKGFFPDDEPKESDPTGGLAVDPKLALNSPRGDNAFLHATLDKSRVVVGEQVTLNVYLYQDLRGRQTSPIDVHEPTAADFVKKSLVADETHATFVGHAMVGGKPWMVQLVRKNALFPLKTGRLSVSPMSLTLAGQKNGVRESETLSVEVVEPPIANRPAGYMIGDTGDFSLSATLTPRTIEQHGAVGVNVELRGSGNMPATLTTPEIAGVEWLEPQTHDALGPQANDRYGGARTFSYVVRVHNAGSIDLGEIRLPYYDPATRAYAVARAAIGIVQTTPNAGRDTGANEVVEAPLSGMPNARATLEGPHPATFLTERGAFWGFLFGSPLACAVVIVMGDSLRKLRERRRSAAPSPERIARERRSEADSAMKGTDGKAAASAVARALEADILVRTGINVRGTSADVLSRELADAGLEETSAKELLDVLAACEDARFSPTDVDVELARTLWDRARAALRQAGTSIPPP